jgi:hypothetical protein
MTGARRTDPDRWEAEHWTLPTPPFTSAREE